jgi:glutamyl-tRNA reductase
VLLAPTVRGAMAQRGDVGLVLIDLAVPGDIHPDVAAIDGCTLRNLDDLEEVVARNVALRRREQAAAEQFCAEAAEDFRAWQAARVVTPTIGLLRTHGEDVALTEARRVAAAWPGLDDEGRERLDRLARGIARKLLHDPTVRLKETAAGSDGIGYAETVRELFALEDTPAGE